MAVFPSSLPAFVRIGPDPIGTPDSQRFHWFTGTGMMHGLRFCGGRAPWYRNRFVNSAEAAVALGREPLPGPGAGTRDGTVNTHLTSTGGRLYALIEGGDLPVELDDELESVTRSDFGGTLEAGFSAHPKFDPLTGLQHAITYEVGQPVRHVTLHPSGRAATGAHRPAPSADDPPNRLYRGEHPRARSIGDLSAAPRAN